MGRGYCIIGTMDDASPPEAGALPGEAAAFLNFCRIEKGLAANSLEAYQADLQKFVQFCRKPVRRRHSGRGSRRPIYGLFVSSRVGQPVGGPALVDAAEFLCVSAARRTYCPSDPTEHLGAPRQWQTIPKFLNLEEIERLSQSADVNRPTGVRDHAMIELLYATGLRVSELCSSGHRGSEPGFGRPAGHRQRQKTADGSGR